MAVHGRQVKKWLKWYPANKEQAQHSINKRTAVDPEGNDNKPGNEAKSRPSPAYSPFLLGSARQLCPYWPLACPYTASLCSPHPWSTNYANGLLLSAHLLLPPSGSVLLALLPNLEL